MSFLVVAAALLAAYPIDNAISQEDDRLRFARAARKRMDSWGPREYVAAVVRLAQTFAAAGIPESRMEVT